MTRLPLLVLFATLLALTVVATTFALLLFVSAVGDVSRVIAP